MSTSNPFEPPLTTDLDAGDGEGDGRDASFISDAALDELDAAGPWVRRLSRITLASMVMQVFGVVASLARPESMGKAIAAVVGGSVGIAISARFFSILRGYAAASKRLRRGSNDAAGQIVVAQAAYFRSAGVLLAIAGSLIGFALIIGIAAGVLSRARH
jgi:hypothetical protein